MRWSGLVLTFCFLLAPPAAAQAADPEDRVVDSYRIGPRDRIQIRVEELPELDSEAEVAADGTISLPDIGTIDVQGVTESQLALRIRSRLETAGLRRATVSVAVISYRSRPVVILGAVTQAGSHFVGRSTSLLEILLTQAAGLAAEHGDEIIVRRQAENGLSDEVRIPVADLIGAGDPNVNIPIFAGDLINVQFAQEVEIYFLGGGVAAGSFSFKSTDRVTLLIAIAGAGGLKETASKKIRIRRLTESGERREIVVDFRRILSGADPDPELRDGDLVIIKESFF